MLLSLLVVELVRRVFQTVVKAVTRSAVGHLGLKSLLQLAGGNLGNTGGEDNAFPFLYINFKISRHIKVFIEVISAFLFFRILNTTIPVRLEVELILFVELHEQLRITGIHAGFNAILYQLVVAACLRIFVRVLAHTAECQERAESECSCRMGIDQGITNQNPIFMMYENLFFTKDDTSYTIGSCGDIFTVELSNVLVSVRTEVVPLILMQPQVELRTVLNYSFIQRRQQHMVFIIKVGDRYHQQTVIFACVTIYNCCTMIGSRPIRPQYLPWQRFLQINHQGLVKS